jgi:uncharacterized membrane protein (TIGR02234 family)
VSPRETTRRELWPWIVATAAGGMLVLLAVGRTWVSVRGSGEVAVPTGGALSPVLTPLAMAGLAGVVAVLATKGVGRRVVGVLLALCGLGVAAATWAAVGGSTVETWLRTHNVAITAAPPAWEVVALWPVVSGLGGVLLFAGGVVAVVRGGRWTGMSDRYERTPGGRPARADGERDLWDALDRGDDPTDSR